MLSHQANRSLTRRGSKLLVEMIIGVIGILGIMLAQNTELVNQNSSGGAADNGKMIQTATTQVAHSVDWLEILF